MKKKGFTLIELLAVIAILAILIIIALPNIMELFNQSKLNSFENEVKEIYRTAQSQWLNDSIMDVSEKIYTMGTNGSAISGCGSRSLKLSGRTDISYGVKINSSGDVVQLYVTDGSFWYGYNDDSNPLSIEDIGHGEYDEEEPFNPNNVFVKMADTSVSTSTILCNTRNSVTNLSTAE